ncbi:hypothetical protein JXM67_00700 [candidate division WOR-3 bacterium]|nr:hypothetical protein [candidate division WOR-3 bacterium]
MNTKDSEPTIKTRRELYDYYEMQMNKAYREVLKARRLESDSTFIKTYMVEFDWGEEERKGGVDFLRKTLALTPTQHRKTLVMPTVHETDEDGFFSVDWLRKDKKLRVYFDTITDPDRRFWLAYSLSDANLLDAVMDRLAMSHSCFDRAWLWPDILKETQAMGEFRGVGLDYDYRAFESREEKGHRESTNYFKVQIWGGRETEEILNFITKKFEKKTVLSKVRLKYTTDGEYSGHFALEDIKYNGKFTARGTSFQTHQILVSNLRTRYSKIIKRLEENYIIRLNDVKGEESIEGNPIFFDLSRNPIENMDAFCDVVFAGTMPFRLWGVPFPMENEPNGRVVSAVDLHSGSKLFFEIYPDIISVYLYRGACGNSIARFFTNIQHRFSKLVLAEDNDGTQLF